MIQANIKILVEKYCMGTEPTEAQEDEIMDAVKAARLDADGRREVVSYMAELMSGPTRTQKLAEEETKRKAEEEARRKAAEEAKRKAEEEARRKAAEEANRKVEAAKKEEQRKIGERNLHEAKSTGVVKECVNPAGYKHQGTVNANYFKNKANPITYLHEKLLKDKDWRLGSIASDGSGVILYGNNNYCSTNLWIKFQNCLRECQDSKKKISLVAHNEVGGWTTIIERNGYSLSSQLTIPSEYSSKLNKYNEDGEKILCVCITERDDWVIITDKHYSASSSEYQEKLKKAYDLYGQVLYACITISAIAVCCKNGMYYENLPINIAEDIQLMDCKLKNISFTDAGLYFIGDEENKTSYSHLVPSEDEVKLYEKYLSEVANGHKYVDLQLPSGNLWATCNVGASSPEKYGDYFAWGETETKEDNKFGILSKHKYRRIFPKSSTKYDEEGDKKTVLDTDDDVPHVKWGENWFTPSKYDFEELLRECTFKKVTHNGVAGYEFSRSGKSVFFPASGEKGGRLTTIKSGEGFSCWTREYEKEDEAYSFEVSNLHGNGGVYKKAIRFGASVRPVMYTGGKDRVQSKLHKLELLLFLSSHS